MLWSDGCCRKGDASWCESDLGRRGQPYSQYCPRHLPPPHPQAREQQLHLHFYCIRTIVITQGPLRLGLLFLLEQSRLSYSIIRGLIGSNYHFPCYCQVMVGVVDPDPLWVVLSTVSLFTGLELVLDPSLCSSWSDVYYLKFAHT